MKRKHIGNTYDVRRPDAESMRPNYSEVTEEERRHSWQEWKRFVLGHIGPPQATDSCTVPELEKMGMVGLYEGPFERK